MKRLILLAFCFLTAASVFAEPLRKTVVMAKGEKRVLTTAGAVNQVTTPPGSPDGVVRFGFQQFGQTLVVEGLKPGDVKILVEYTDSSIGEVLDVFVTDKKVYDIWRTVSAQLAGLPGTDDHSVLPAGKNIVVSGRLFSLIDENRCRSLEIAASNAVPAVICAAGMSSAATVAYPDGGYLPVANIQVTESSNPLPSETTKGLESPSHWSVTVRFGDVPAMILSSSNRDDLLARVGVFVWRLNHALRQWNDAAGAGSVPYPTTFQISRSGANWALGMTWRLDQGTKGEPLIVLSPEDLGDMAGAAGGADRALAWAAAIFQDSFRMYEMAERPDRTQSEQMLKVYQTALTMKGSLDRSSAPLALARAWYSLQLSGTDPLASLPTRPPAGFNPMTGH